MTLSGTASILQKLLSQTIIYKKKQIGVATPQMLVYPKEATNKNIKSAEIMQHNVSKSYNNIFSTNVTQFNYPKNKLLDNDYSKTFAKKATRS